MLREFIGFWFITLVFIFWSRDTCAPLNRQTKKSTKNGRVIQNVALSGLKSAVFAYKPYIYMGAHTHTPQRLGLWRVCLPFAFAASFLRRSLLAESVISANALLGVDVVADSWLLAVGSWHLGSSELCYASMRSKPIDFFLAFFPTFFILFYFPVFPFSLFPSTHVLPIMACMCEGIRSAPKMVLCHGIHCV